MLKSAVSYFNVYSHVITLTPLYLKLEAFLDSVFWLEVLGLLICMIKLVTVNNFLYQCD